MSFLLDFTSFFEDNGLDDSVDRLNRQWVSTFLLLIVGLSGLNQYVGDPIHCFTPTYFSGAQESYADSYCWTASTYHLLETKYDPLNPYGSVQAVLHATDIDSKLVYRDADSGVTELRKIIKVSGQKTLVNYYQWVPLILLMQAVLFFLPYKLWKTTSGDGGVDIEQIMIAAKELGQCKGDIHERHLTLVNVCDLFGEYIEVTRPEAGEATSCAAVIPARVARFLGCTADTFYVFRFLFMKFLYVVNLFFQLYALHVFLGTSILLHGLDVFQSFVVQSKWTDSDRFPINTVCQVRGYAQVHGYLTTHAFQCVLPINLYNDKFYAIITLTFAVVFVITKFNFWAWVFALVVPSSREGVVRKHLSDSLTKPVRDAKKDPNEEKGVMNGHRDGLADGIRFSEVNSFINEELRVDGCFLLMLIDSNLSSSVAAQVVRRLWKNYQEKKHSHIAACHLDLLTQKLRINGEDIRLKMHSYCGVHQNAAQTIDIHNQGSGTYQFDNSTMPNHLEEGGVLL